MKQNIAKYFWGFNEKALKEAENILKDIKHPRFVERIIAILSRCDRPKELFSIISKDDFVAIWPKIRNYWRRIAPKSDFRDWWQTVYEQIIKQDAGKPKRPNGEPANSFLNIGKMIKHKRVQKGLTQQELALRTGIKQPDISKIEEGKKNITLETLTLVCKALNIKKVEL